MVTLSLRSLRAHPVRILASALPIRSVAYLLSGLLLAIPTAVAVVVFPLLLLLPFWSWTLSAVERRRVRLLGFDPVPLPPPELRVPPLAHASARLRSALGWREIAGALLHLLYAALTFLLTIVLVIATVTLVSAPLLPLAGRAYVVGSWRIEHPLTALPVTLAGLLLLVLSGYGAILLAYSQATVTRLLIGSRVEVLEQQVDKLAGSQVALIEAFEAERQRIERDLHDGPQQHLAGAALHLGILRAHLDTGDAPRRTSVTDALEAAHQEVELALDALRSAVSGLRPRLLVEDGLAAALTELAHRSPIPATVDTEGLGRMPAPVEASLYSIASEFVANSLKHSHATAITITTAASVQGLRLTLTDNGHGGADRDAGTGLIGIEQRVRLLGGTMLLDSPHGGPTTLTVHIPKDVITNEAA